jgi:hypothetical protein
MTGCKASRADPVDAVESDIADKHDEREHGNLRQVRFCRISHDDEAYRVGFAACGCESF